MTSLKGAQLNLLANRLRSRDALDNQSVDLLLRRAVKDGEVQGSEAAALRRLVLAEDDTIRPDARARLDKLLAIEHTDIQALALRLELDDGQISLADSCKIRELVLKDGQIDSGEQYSLAAMLVASRMSAGAQEQVKELAEGRAPDTEAVDWQQRILAAEVSLTELPSRLAADHVFVRNLLATEPKLIAELPTDLNSDVDFLCAVLAELPDCAKHIAAPVSDKKLFMALIDIDGEHFDKGSAALKQDFELARRAARNGYWIGGSDPALRDDYDFVLANVQQHARAFDWASPRLQADKGLALKAVEQGYGVPNLSPELQADRDIALASVGVYGHRLEQLAEVHRDDPEIVKTAVENDWRALWSASERHQGDRGLVSSAVAQNGKALYAASPALQEDRELVLTACRSGQFYLRDAPPMLWQDREIALAAVASDTSNLDCLSPELKRDPEIARVAIERRATSFNKLDSALRADPEMALYALQHCDDRSGEKLELAPSLRDDAAFAKRALSVNPSALGALEPSLRANPSLVRLAVKHNYQALRWADPALANNKSFVAELIKDIGGAVFSYASHQLRADRELLSIALDDAVEAMTWAGNALKRDPEMARKTLLSKGGALEWLDPELRKDKELAMIAVPIDPWAYWELDPSIKRDPDVLVLAGASFPRSLPHLLRDDDALDATLLERLARANPLTLEHMSESQRALVLQRYPQAAQQCQLRADALRELDIEFAHRMRPLAVLDEIIDNRRTPRSIDDRRPTALLVYNKDDHNGAFSVDNVSQLCDHYRVLYYEAATDTDVQAALEEVSAQGERAELFVMAGHGTREQTAMGAPDPARAETLDDEVAYVDLGDQASLQPSLRAAILPDAQVVIESCSTGEGRGAEANLANMFAEILPSATVYAPIQPTNNRIRVDDRGRFADPGFWAGKAETYVINPRSAAAE